MDLQFSGIGRLISQSLQRQTQVTLASLGWSLMSRECTKSCVGLFLPVLVCCIVAASMWLRQEGYKVYETLSEVWHVKWRGLLVYNPAISTSHSTESVLMYSMVALLQTTVGIPPVNLVYLLRYEVTAANSGMQFRSRSPCFESTCKKSAWKWKLLRITLGEAKFSYPVRVMVLYKVGTTTQFPSMVNGNFYFVIFSGSAAQRGLWPARFTRLLDHTHRRSTVGRTPLDEW
jgi:hypothetical protein